jgi:hypothetical protein
VLKGMKDKFLKISTEEINFRKSKKKKERERKKRNI